MRRVDRPHPIFNDAMVGHGLYLPIYHFHRPCRARSRNKNTCLNSSQVPIKLWVRISWTADQNGPTYMPWLDVLID